MKEVALFATCLADWIRPSVAMAAVQVLEAFGCHVHVPRSQTCCAQPAYNSGDCDSAKAVARHTIKAFQDYPYVVIPSGACAGMIKTHYTQLFKDDPKTLEQVVKLQDRTYEFCQFFVQVLNVETWPASLPQAPNPTPITYHDSCAGLRELGIKNEPRAMIKLKGGQITRLEDEEDCCGFGGAFAAKYGEISSAIAARKCEAIDKTGCNTVVLGDVGCMLNIEGKLRAQGKSTKVLHIAEYLLK